MTTTPKPEPKPEPKPAAAFAPGDFALYASFDHHGTGAERDQLILVTGVNADGTISGKALGWADEGASFAPGQLRAPAAGGGDGDGHEGG